MNTSRKMLAIAGAALLVGMPLGPPAQAAQPAQHDSPVTHTAVKEQSEPNRDWPTSDVTIVNNTGATVTLDSYYPTTYQMSLSNVPNYILNGQSVTVNYAAALTGWGEGQMPDNWHIDSDDAANLNYSTTNDSGRGYQILLHGAPQESSQAGEADISLDGNVRAFERYANVTNVLDSGAKVVLR